MKNRLNKIRLTLKALLLATMVAAGFGQNAQGQTWDKSNSNGYVQKGYPGECTAYSHGRFKTLNGEWPVYKDSTGSATFPGAAKMWDQVVETATIYRDSVPVMGGIAVWNVPAIPNDPGHVATPESSDSKGNIKFSEQNWPTGSGPLYRELKPADVQNRVSTSSNGTKKTYVLRGYINPNRAPSIGTLYTQPFSSTLQVDVALKDEDNRNLRVLAAVVDGSSVVSGTTIDGSVPANKAVRLLFNASKLKKGKSYTVQLWVWDFKNLRSAKSTSIKW